MRRRTVSSFFFFFNDTATTEIYTLSLHDALPILMMGRAFPLKAVPGQNIHDLDASSLRCAMWTNAGAGYSYSRSEEHTSELQSPCNLVCRLLLEKKNNLSMRARVDRIRRTLAD